MRKIFALSAILLTGVSIIFFYYSGKKTQKNIATQQTATLIETKSVEEKILPAHLIAYGSTESVDSIDISPEISGQIAALSFRAGQYVKKGQPLIQLEDTLYQSELKLSRSNLTLSQLDLNRIATLNAKNLSSAQALDNAKALVVEKKAALTATRSNLNKTRLKAPFNGVLGEKKISIGQYVITGMPLLHIDAIDTIKVKYHLPETYLTALHLDQPVYIKSIAIPNKRFLGKVTFISPTINPNTHMLTLEAEFPNNKHELLPGLFVEINQTLDKATPVLLVPEEALIPTIEGQSVFIIEENKAKSVAVSIGDVIDNEVVITKGLTLKDKIIIRGQHKLKDGALIKDKHSHV